MKNRMYLLNWDKDFDIFKEQIFCSATLDYCVFNTCFVATKAVILRSAGLLIYSTETFTKPNVLWIYFFVNLGFD